MCVYFQFFFKFLVFEVAIYANKDVYNGVSLYEARRADSGGGVLGDGAAKPPPHK